MGDNICKSKASLEKQKNPIRKHAKDIKIQFTKEVIKTAKSTKKDIQGQDIMLRKKKPILKSHI